MALTLSGITRNNPNGSNGTGMKGYALITLSDEYGRAKDVETLTDNVITAITTEAEFHLFEVERESVTWTVKNEGGTDSKNFNVEGGFFIPGITPERSFQLERLVNYPATMIVEDRRTNLRMIGDKYDGVSISYEEVTEGRNGYLMKYEIKGLGESPRFVAGMDIVPLVGS